MSIIPNKHLFLVTSTLNANIGVFDHETRLNQTLETLRVLRAKVPDAIIVLTDSSPTIVPDSVANELSKSSNLNIMFQQDQDLVTLANAGLKSQAEIILLHKTLSIIKSNSFFGIRFIFIIGKGLWRNKALKLGRNSAQNARMKCKAVNKLCLK